ncbi:hypothetical protein [Haloglomus litoreum]|uniref:hypothetical protein n=1 Tax=Haloglomus litoreum TaxID=3034026 RepID=UPI0023E7B962|nr:hypothetical protein [Haloglomus sp. DT116]
MRRHALLAVVVVGLALAGAGATTATPSPVAGSHNDTITAEFQPDTVAAGANTTLLVNNTSSDTISIDSPDMPAERLHRVVEGSPSGDEVIANVSDGRVAVRFDECGRPGEYEFVLSGTTMTPNANATVEVVAPADTSPAFEDSVTRVRPGGTAAIGIDTDCGDRATLHVGSGSANFSANATLNLSPGHNVVSLDTNATNTADAVFAAGPNATLANVTLADPADPPLPAGEYDLTLTVNGSATDLGVLSVTEDANRNGSTTPTATPTPTTPTAGPEPPTPSPSPHAPDTPDTATASPTPTDGDDGTPPVTSSDGQPGFGVGVAIISIISALYARKPT